jgi:hypothetical protein
VNNFSSNANFDTSGKDRMSQQSPNYFKTPSIRIETPENDIQLTPSFSSQRKTSNKEHNDHNYEFNTQDKINYMSQMHKKDNNR